MIENAHKDHEIEGLVELSDVVDGQVAKFDVEFVDLCREAGLREVFIAAVEPKHAIRAAALHLHRVKAGVTADIQHGFSLQRFGYDVGEVAPFHRWIVAEKMRWRGWDAMKIKVVEPRPKRIDPAADLLSRERTAIHLPAPLEAMALATDVWNGARSTRGALASCRLRSSVIAVR